MISQANRFLPPGKPAADYRHQALQRKIGQAKKLLPLPDLMDELGDGDLVSSSAPCPFHPDSKPSFSVFRNKQGQWLWNCFAGCGCGDEVCYLQTKLEITRGEAIREFLNMAGVE